MGSLVKIDGSPEWDAEGVTTVQDATPLDPSDTFGGTGTIAFEIPATPAAKSMLGGDVELIDSVRGTVRGTVAAVGGNRANTGIRAHSRLQPLVASRSAAPHVGTLESVLLYYFGLCGITDGIVVDPAIADTTVVAPGWYGDVWEQIKDLTAAYGFAVDVVGTDIVARPPRTNTLTRQDEAGFQWSLDKSRMAQTVEAWYYPVEPITDQLVVGNDLFPISNLDAGEMHEFDVDIPASLSSVQQPVCMDSVAFDEASASVYSVVDNFDDPVDADMWRRNGGYVRVEINDDTRSLHVTVVGCQERSRAPYRLVGVALGKDEYSTLRIVGTGVSLSRAKYTLPAAIDAAPEVGASVDNHFLGSWGHAHLALLGTVGRYGMPVQRISGEVDDDGLYGNIAGARVFEDLNAYRVRAATITSARVAYQAEPDLTLDDVDALLTTRTFDEWDAVWLGRPFDEFDLRPLTPIPGEGVVTPTTGYGSGVYGGPPNYGG